MKTKYSFNKFLINVPQVFLILFMMIQVSALAQRFEWVNFTPIVSGYPNGGSGGKVMTVDNAGNIYTLADFSEPVIAGEDTIVPFFAGSTDIYLTKWTPDGNVLWARPFGGNWYDDGLDLEFDGINNQVYASAHIQGTQTFLIDTILTNTIDYQILVFDTAGNFIKNRFTGWSNVALAIQDEIIYFSDNWNTIRRVDPEGNVIFSLSPSSTTGYFFFSTVEITPQYDLLAAGIFAGSFVIGDDTVESVSAPSGEHTFLIKADSSGQLIFAVYTGSFGLTYNRRIPLVSDESGNTYMSDNYAHDGVIFGEDTLLHYSSNRDAFIAKYNPTGISVWGRHFYGTADTEPMDMIFRDGYLFNCGKYAGTMVFGSNTLPNTGSLGYIAKMSISGDYDYAKEVGSYNGSSWAAALEAGSEDQYFINGMTYGGGSNSVFGCYTQAYSNQYLTSFEDTGQIIPEVNITIQDNYLIATHNCDCSIQWYLNAVPIAGETGEYLPVTDNGDYYAIVQDDYNCSAQSNTITIINAGVSDLVDSRIKISPNPFSSSIRIEITGTPSLEKYSLKIMNLTGQTLYSVAANDDNGQTIISLDLSFLNKGFYLFELKSQGLRITRKIAKL
jgi:hypothetical protein